METFTGALPDTRPQEEREKDYKKEVLASGVLDFKERKFEDIKNFPVRDQDGSSSCVAQSLALILGIENHLEENRFIELSAKDIYTRRKNEGGGMIGVDALDIAKKYGATLEVLIPSQQMNESEINIVDRKVSDKEIAQIFKIKDYWQLKFDLNQIATIMEGGRKRGVAKPVMVWFQFPRSEWNSEPQVTSDSYDIVRHSVTAIEYGKLNGKRGIWIQDSWGHHSTTLNGLRFISEEYIKARMIFCAYVNDLPNDYEPVDRPEFNGVLKIGSKGDDVKLIQDKLGVFADGDFGKITQKAVIDFQRANHLTVDGIVGINTWNKLFS